MQGAGVFMMVVMQLPADPGIDRERSQDPDHEEHAVVYGFIGFEIHPVDEVMLHFVEDAKEKGIDKDHGPGREYAYPPQVTIYSHQAAAEQEDKHTPEVLVF